MNMQHARMATSLMARDILGAEAQTVIALIQEPYVGKGGVPLGFPGGVKMPSRGERKLEQQLSQKAWIYCFARLFQAMM